MRTRAPTRLCGGVRMGMDTQVVPKAGEQKSASVLQTNGLHSMDRSRQEVVAEKNRLSEETPVAVWKDWKGQLKEATPRDGL